MYCAQSGWGYTVISVLENVLAFQYDPLANLKVRRLLGAHEKELKHRKYKYYTNLFETSSFVMIFSLQGYEM